MYNGKIGLRQYEIDAHSMQLLLYTIQIKGF